MNIKKRWDEFLTLKKTFGYAFALKCYLLRLKSFAEYEQFIFNFLEVEFEPLIRKYEQIQDTDVLDSGSKYIWTLWWQGTDQAPEIVKACLKSQQDNMVSGEFQYTIITKDNWQQYIELPTYILEKVESGRITITHFSDIIRAELIRRYGGIWIDATVYCNKKINIQPISGFFTVKSSPISKSLTLGRWTGFFVGDTKNSKLFAFMAEAFEFYWKKYDALVAYLLIDYIIAIAYKHFQDIKEQVDNIPVTNVNLWYMLRRLNLPYNKEEWKKIIVDTDFFKLSYKAEFNGGELNRTTKDGQITNCGYILSQMSSEMEN